MLYAQYTSIFFLKRLDFIDIVPLTGGVAFLNANSLWKDNV